jgi:hypothetical protein
LEDRVRAAVAVRVPVAGGEVRGAVGCDLPDRAAAGSACDIDVSLSVDRDVIEAAELSAERRAIRVIALR